MKRTKMDFVPTQSSRMLGKPSWEYITQPEAITISDVNEVLCAPLKSPNTFEVCVLSLWEILEMRIHGHGI